MPLTLLQERTLGLLAKNRSPNSHLAGAAGIHLSPESPRKSHDLDLFHDSLEAVANAFDPVTAKREYLNALDEADSWIRERPATETGCLYVDPASGRFFAPAAGERAQVHRGGPGGVFPRIDGLFPESLAQSPELRSELEKFFARKLKT